MSACAIDTRERGVLQIRDEADLAEAVRSAQGSLRPTGGGTKALGRPVAGEVLSLSALSGITLYEPGALTIIARAGTPLADVEATLEAEGQHLPFEPMDFRPLLRTKGEPTIGGVVAANASGPRRVQSGACRDALIGVRFVDGTGTVIRNGGRVMKNVTGYDLVKLMAGSWGTLGVLTEVAFKVLPRPEAAAGIELDGLTDEAAVQAMSAALGSPFDVAGAAHESGGKTRIRVEGFAASVAYRAERVAAVLAKFGAPRVETDRSNVARDWRSIRDAVPVAGGTGDVWRLSGRPSEMAGVVARANAEASLYDWGGGLAWVRVAEGSDLRSALGRFAGHATLVRAAPETRARVAPFPPGEAAIATLSRDLRARFDPRGILNPGLMD